jgi:hypothetical protein
MTVEDGIKFVISGGSFLPQGWREIPIEDWGEGSHG